MGRNTPESKARGVIQEKARQALYRADRDRFVVEWEKVYPQARKRRSKSLTRWRYAFTDEALAILGLHLRWHFAAENINYEALARGEFKDNIRLHGERFMQKMTKKQKAWHDTLRERGEAKMEAWLAENLRLTKARAAAKANRWRETSERLAEKKRVRREKEARRLEGIALKKEKALARKAAWEERTILLRKWQAKYGHLFVKDRISKSTSKRRRDEVELAADKATRILVKRIHDGPAKCYWCGKRLPKGGTVDHITPLAKGGKHDTSNIAAACGRCNTEKSDTMPQQVNLPLGPAFL